MAMQSLSNINPVDGRYQKITRPLSAYFSEEALIRYRIMVEVKYFLALTDIPLPPLSQIKKEDLEKALSVIDTFDHSHALRIKTIEEETNHDIKAVEYFIKERFDAFGMQKYREMVHFGLTSQDINNTAIPLSLKEGLEAVIYPALHELLNKIRELSNKWLQVPMLARTHGQPASPTSMGKELRVFHERLTQQMIMLKALPFNAKFGGATGNFNAHHVCYPDVDWNSFADRFVQSLGLERSRITTQIDHYDGLAAIFDNLKRLLTILIDLARDCWSYVSMDYFTQKVMESETGSSAMPHKINPIDFENAEGNAGIAIALLEHLSAKLPVSRLQRDLSDSTVLRNIGVPLGHMLIALKAITKGLGKISLNIAKINDDLEKHTVVVAEAIQSMLRSMNYPEPYEGLKKLTRQNRIITREMIDQYIDELDIDPKDKERMKKISPFNYTGIIPDPLP
ncbi:MAG: adenylosuccinate lyase [Bacteroidia bacterium]|nr:MAG: adenylosuccinate lyase [Bacteroidia bacterium]